MPDKLLIDDLRMPGIVQWMDEYNYVYQEPGWRIVRNMKQFVDFITTHRLPKLIAFDHDLEYQVVPGEPIILQDGGKQITLSSCNYDTSQPTGLDCLRWLIEYCKNTKQEIPQLLCHSHNINGKERIEKLIKSINR